MPNSNIRRCLFALLLGLVLAPLQAADFPVCLVSDPPPAIDGTLERLSKLPTLAAVAEPERILFGAQNWQHAADYSASVMVGYDKLHLYVGAAIRDDRHSQEHFSRNLWRGDHVMLVIDYPRQEDQPNLGKVFRLGISPGNFAGNGPETWFWSPADTFSETVRVGAVKTAEGYQIEAAIPWELLGMQPEPGLAFGFDLLLSDSDSDNQDTLFTLGGGLTPKLPHHPARLLTAVLADANGRIDPAASRRHGDQPLSEVLTVPHGESVTFAIPDAQVAEMEELVVRARIESTRTGGATYVMQLFLNDQPLTQAEVRNRDEKLYYRRYILAPATTGHVWYLPYGPNFALNNNEPFRSGGTTIDPCLLRFAVKRLLRPSGNMVRIVHARPLPSLAPLQVQLAASAQLSPKLAEEIRLKPAPTGPLPRLQPNLPLEQPLYQGRLTAGGALAVEFAGERVVLSSSYSTLTPGWASLGETADGGEWRIEQASDGVWRGATAHFTLERELRRHADALQVVDTIRNTGSEPLPLMYRHILPEPAGVADVRAAGFPVRTPSFVTQNGAHPVAAMFSGGHGWALVGEDDFSRAQGQLFRRQGAIGLENLRLVLAPGRTISLEYTLLPLERPDYFLAINRIRQRWGVNFTLAAGGSMLPARTAARMSDRQVLDFLRHKSVAYAIDNVPVLGGIVTHGRKWHEVDMEPTRVFNRRLRQLAPDVRHVLYYHCFLSNGSNDLETYRDDVMLTASGAVCDYGGGKYPIFLPAPGSPFARLQEELLEARYALGIDGIFWDEVAYSMYMYDYNPRHWDGVSAEIDSKTHQIRRKVTNVTLATLEWRLALARRMLEKGVLIGNGAPQTRSFTRLHFPRFIETGSITNLVHGQLYTPIALGDHHSERNGYDAYRNMVRGLDYGALYYWYRAEIQPSHPTLTDCMFPITPLTLGPGYIFGRERLLTNCSGLFSWGDRCSVTTRVFNREGIEEDYAVPVREEEGKTWIEVRIPEGYSVAVIRSAPLPP